MKKLVIGSMILFSAGIATAKAETASVSSGNMPASLVRCIVQDSTPVQASDLPDAIKTKLANGHFKQWTVSSAFLFTGSTEYYEINLVNGTETKTIKLDQNGKRVEN
jgi:hypothetical protein